MSGVRGEGIGGLAKTREDYTTSRYDLYAQYEFEEEVTQRDKFYYYPQHILSVYDSSMPIKFQVPPEVEYFTDLSSLKLHGELSVHNVTEDKAPAAAEEWSLCNNFINACFANVDALINQHAITDSSRNPYPYKSVKECILVHKPWYVENIMCSDGFYKDTSQLATKDAETVGYNAGWIGRRNKIKTGGKLGLFSLLET